MTNFEENDTIYIQKFWKLYDLLVRKAHETYDKVDEDAIYRTDLECIFKQFMADEFEHYSRDNKELLK